MKNKNYLFSFKCALIVLACVGGSCTSGTPAQQEDVSNVEISDEQKPVLTFDKDAFEFGVVNEGNVVTHTYEFTNTGNTPLILQAVQVSCGCTTPEYSKAPIAPGKKGKVKIAFDSAGQLGKQHKIVTVTSNALTRHTLLHLRGEVVKYTILI